MPFLSFLVRSVFALLLVATTIAHVSNQASAAPSLYYLYGSGSQTGGKQITLRVQLTEDSPGGGTTVALTSNDLAVTVPATVQVPAGNSEILFNVNTSAVSTDRSVVVSATLNGVTRSRSVLIKAPILTSIGLQTVIRHGGQGKVIIRLSGPAPASGLDVSAVVDPPVLSLPATISVPAGVQSLSLKPDADMFATSALPPDQPFTLTVSEGPRSFSKSAVVRMFSTDPLPTATLTPIASPTNTATATSTIVPSTATATATSTIPASTATPSSTATATATSTVPAPTSTATSTPVPTSTPIQETATATIAPGFSEACSALNGPSYDGLYSSSSISSLLFEPGDQIVWVFTGNGPTVEILLSGMFVQFSGPSQDMHTLTIFSDGTYSLSWTSTGGAVTWDVSCTSDNPI